MKSFKGQSADRKKNRVHTEVEGEQLGDQGGQEADEAGVHLDIMKTRCSL